ncbi:hypothetical protein ACFOOL_14265 [Devosia honganensis]|uniref:Uncharacterized protein n=1 Tax=Devosia honganensis TaxID=1610527 RepID=A0ABV7X5M6_9HYPH
MDWYDRVTGTTEYQRQSWRDNYNDGRAAGDWTGSVNARLDREREAFQGATWSGSSSQPSALELARSMGSGSGTSGASTGSGGGGSGPGSPRVTTGRGGGGRGSGSNLVLSTPGPLEIGVKDEGTGLLVGGDWWQSNPWWSDASEWEERYGEPGDWIGGVVVASADLMFNAGRFADWGFGTDIVSNARKDDPRAREIMDSWATGPGAWNAISDAFVRQDGRISQQLHRALGTGYVVPMGGF